MVKFIKSSLIFLPLISSREFTGGGFEYFSSFAHMATLQKLEFDFVKFLKVEINAEKKWNKNKIDATENEADQALYQQSIDFLNRIEQLHNVSDQHTVISDPKQIWRKEKLPEYDSQYNKLLANPVNQYKLIDRMLEAWPTAISQIKEYAPGVEHVYQTMIQSHGGLPGESDLNGAADALLRLQDTYLLDTKDFADAEIFGNRGNSKLTTENCFHIGQQAYWLRFYIF